MNLRDIIESAGAPAISQMARQLGIDEGDARSAAGQMLPALARGLQRNATQPGGLDSLLGALAGGGHERYVEHPREIGNPATIADGNAILEHILGSKDVSRNVAGHAAAETGLDASVLRKMLPMLAAVAMGALSKQTQSGTAVASANAQGSGTSILDMLGGALDANHDGSVADDLLNLARKFF